MTVVAAPSYSFLRTEVQTRRKGHTATGVVCYRMGLAAVSTIPRADGTERAFDYTRRSGVVTTGWAAPPGTDPSWSDPVEWARRIEAVDRRKNSRQCRDDVVALPVELVERGLAQAAMQQYADRLAELHRTVVHYAIHSPARGGVNWHGHTLYPGRYVEGLGFSRRRDRTQDNPLDRGAPNLTKVHKGIWSKICSAHGIELAWSSETPGHHLGPKICATKRRRLVAETRDAVAMTITASPTGEAAPDERVLDEVAVIASGVNEGLTVNEMLHIELKHAQHGQPEPRAVTAPVPPQPEVLPPPVIAPKILPPPAIAPKILPPAEKAPQVLPPVRPEPEVLPPEHAMPEVLQPTRQLPEVLPPVGLVPRVLPPARRADVLPPTRTAPEILPPARKPLEIPRPQVREREQEFFEFVGTIVLATEPKHSEPSSTWTAVHVQLANGHKTPVSEIASSAAEELATRARRREESEGMPPPPAAEPDRIRMLVEWLLEFVRRMLEQLHLKTEKAKSEPEPRERPFQPRPLGAGQKRKHGRQPSDSVSRPWRTGEKNDGGQSGPARRNKAPAPGWRR